jgi:hypothetical protein
MDKANNMDAFFSRLSSANKDGLNAPSLNPTYVCHYRGSLIGKHFKSIVQVMPFLVHDLLPQNVINGWTCIGTLVILLWHTSIDDIEDYLLHLKRTIDEFLVITAQCAPSIIITKPKFHFLVHLPMFIRRFGPALLYSTERYESFNHVFRLCSIYSNKQAPSRDICTMFASMDAIKHIVSGGYWYDKTKCKWMCAGSAILSNKEEYVKYLGHHPDTRTKAGMCRLNWDCHRSAKAGTRNCKAFPRKEKATKQY